MSSGRFYFQVEDAVARAMQPFVDQLVSLSKNVQKLKGEESDEQEVSFESSKNEPCQKIIVAEHLHSKSGAKEEKGEQSSPFHCKASSFCSNQPITC